MGDDYIWIEIGKQIEVYSLYQTAKIEAKNFQKQFPDWKKFITNNICRNSQKVIIYIRDIDPDLILHSVKVKGIIISSVKPGIESGIAPGTYKDGLLSMAPTTLHHLPHNREKSYEKIVKINRSLKIYNLTLGLNQNITRTFQAII